MKKLGMLTLSVICLMTTQGCGRKDDPSFVPKTTVGETQSQEVVDGDEAAERVEPLRPPLEDTITRTVESLPPEEVTAGPSGPNPLDVIGGTLADGFVDPSEMFVIGAKVWQILEASKPVVRVESQKISVLPGGAKSWRQMSGWNPEPAKKTVRHEIRNIFNGLIVAQTYTVIAYYGGQFEGRGQYLMNVTVIPDVKAMGPWKVNTTVTVGDPVNIGTEENPIPSVEVTVKWSAKMSIMQHFEGREVFYVQGNGVITEIEKTPAKIIK